MTHLAGQGIGFRDPFTSTEAWVPLQVGDENQLLFADMRVIVNNASKLGANMGVGFRRFVPAQERVWGVNGYYDYRDSGEVRHNQVGFGLESLGRYCDWRLNVYMPINPKLTVISDTYDCANPRYDGFYLFLTRTIVKETALRGFDTEIGGTIWDRYRVRGYLGTYLFDGQETAQALGFRARIETQATDQLNLQLVYQTDKVFGGTVYGGGTLSWPGVGRREVAEDQSDVLDRLADPVNRLYNIVLNRPVEQFQESAQDPVSGQPIRFVFVDDDAAAGGTGAENSPFNTLAQAEANSLPGDIIFVRAGTYTDSIALQSGQRLLGDGIGLPTTVNGCFLGGYVISTLQCPEGVFLPNVSRNIGDRPTILGVPGDAITLADRNEVASFNIVNPGDSGIAGAGINNFDIHDVNITGAGGFGIDIRDAFNVGSIRGVNVTGSAGGIRIVNGGQTNLNVDIACNTLSQNFGDGIRIITQDQGGITATVRENIATFNAGFGMTARAEQGSINMNAFDNQFVSNNLGGAFVGAVDGTFTGVFTTNLFDSNNSGGAQPAGAPGLAVVVGEGLASAGNVDLTLVGNSFQLNEG
ncbi:MAG TPA: inverse autotransporter beta domain-containing protein, partial [Planctomycetia bacterium]|nr:inverse autotransporter beta domain-containing protein [Planctomycetia bacterium]